MQLEEFRKKKAAEKAAGEALPASQNAASKQGPISPAAAPSISSGPFVSPITTFTRKQEGPIFGTGPPFAEAPPKIHPEALSSSSFKKLPGSFENALPASPFSSSVLPAQQPFFSSKESPRQGETTTTGISSPKLASTFEIATNEDSTKKSISSQPNIGSPIPTNAAAAAAAVGTSSIIAATAPISSGSIRSPKIASPSAVSSSSGPFSSTAVAAVSGGFGFGSISAPFSSSNTDNSVPLATSNNPRETPYETHTFYPTSQHVGGHFPSTKSDPKIILDALPPPIVGPTTVPMLSETITQNYSENSSSPRATAPSSSSLENGNASGVRTFTWNRNNAGSSTSLSSAANATGVSIHNKGQSKIPSPPPLVQTPPSNVVVQNPVVQSPSSPRASQIENTREESIRPLENKTPSFSSYIGDNGAVDDPTSYSPNKKEEHPPSSVHKSASSGFLGALQAFMSPVPLENELEFQKIEATGDVVVGVGSPKAKQLNHQWPAPSQPSLPAISAKEPSPEATTSSNTLVEKPAYEEGVGEMSHFQSYPVNQLFESNGHGTTHNTPLPSSSSFPSTSSEQNPSQNHQDKYWGLLSTNAQAIPTFTNYQDNVSGTQNYTQNQEGPQVEPTREEALPIPFPRGEEDLAPVLAIGSDRSTSPAPSNSEAKSVVSVSTAARSTAPSQRPQDFKELQHHIGELTDEKFTLQRCLEQQSELADRLAAENETLAIQINSSARSAEMALQEVEIRRQEVAAARDAVATAMAERDAYEMSAHEASERANALAVEVVSLEEKVLRMRSEQMKMQSEVEHGRSASSLQRRRREEEQEKEKEKEKSLPKQQQIQNFSSEGLASSADADTTNAAPLETAVARVEEAERMSRALKGQVESMNEELERILGEKEMVEGRLRNALAEVSGLEEALRVAEEQREVAAATAKESMATAEASMEAVVVAEARAAQATAAAFAAQATNATSSSISQNLILEEDSEVPFTPGFSVPSLSEHQTFHLEKKEDLRSDLHRPPPSALIAADAMADIAISNSNTNGTAGQVVDGTGLVVSEESVTPAVPAEIRALLPPAVWSAGADGLDPTVHDLIERIYEVVGLLEEEKLEAAEVAAVQFRELEALREKNSVLEAKIAALQGREILEAQRVDNQN